MVTEDKSLLLIKKIQPNLLSYALLNTEIFVEQFYIIGDIILIMYT